MPAPEDRESIPARKAQRTIRRIGTERVGQPQRGGEQSWQLRALAEPDIRRRYAELGLDIVGSTPDQFAQTIDAELVKRAKVIKVAGIRLE